MESVLGLAVNAEVACPPPASPPSRTQGPRHESIALRSVRAVSVFATRGDLRYGGIIVVHS